MTTPSLVEQTETLAAAPTRREGMSLGGRFARRFLRHRLAVFGAIVIIVLSAIAAAAPLLSPYDPIKDTDFKALRKPPTAQHWLGTDANGRDVFSRLIWGGRVSLMVGLAAALISVSIGTVIGLTSGFFGGRVDFWLMRLTEVVMTIPTLMIIISLVAVLGPSMFNIIGVIGIFGWAGLARLVRGEVLSLREREFVTASRCVGASSSRIMFRHILPNTMAPIIVAGTFAIAGAILSEAGLSFLGLGVQVPTPTWGNMLTNAQSLTVLESMLWLWLPPGLLITLVVLGINFVGDALRDALDPRLLNK